MARILVLGASGMLGHKLCQVLGARHDVWGAVRGPVAWLAGRGILPSHRLIGGVDASDTTALLAAFETSRPELVINAVGVIKQLREGHDAVTTLKINALFPQELARLCNVAGARLIHVSTDCVFSGRRGNYTEDDLTDAEDLYGRTKALGEVGAPHLTLRTSIIGRELRGRRGLVEWFLSQRGARVHGYLGVRYSGVTTHVLARAIEAARERPDLTGIFQVASQPITKHDLLLLLDKAYGAKTDVVPASEPRLDRTLDGSRFARATGFATPSWPEMIEEMAADPTPYDAWRREDAL